MKAAACDLPSPATVFCNALHLFRSPRFAVGELPQRMHPATALGRICCVATLSLPPVQSADCQLGQYSRPQLDSPWSRMQSLRGSHFLAISGYRISHLHSFCDLLPALWVQLDS